MKLNVHMKDVLFEDWWNRKGSAMRPAPIHDHEEHAKIVARAAFERGVKVGEVWNDGKPS